MENSLRELLKTFERDLTVESKVMDLLSRYSGSVSGNARPDAVVVDQRFHASPSKAAKGNS